MKIILGSQSEGRRRVLEDAGVNFDIMPADIDEKAIRDDDPEKMVLAIARAKADKLLPLIDAPSLLITSDQVTLCDDEVREKPETTEEARQFLRSYGSLPVKTITAVVVTNTATQNQASGIDITTVYFKPIPESAIDAIIDDGIAMRNAGGFAVEHPLFIPYIDHLDGTEDSTMGLPLEMTNRLLKQVEN